MPRISPERRAVLKKRAKGGDEVAAEELKAARAHDAERWKRWSHKKRDERKANGEEVNECHEVEGEDTTEHTIRHLRQRNGRFATAPSPTITETTEDTLIVSSRKAPTEPAEIVELSDSSEEEDRVKMEADVQAQIAPSTSQPELEKEKRNIAEAEIQLKLEKLARKKAKAKLDRRLVEIEKAMLNDEDEEADLKLDLLRAQRT